MIVRTQPSQTPRHSTIAKPRPPLRRRAMCQFIALALFGGGAHAATPPAFSPAWFAAKQATATQPVTPTSGAGGTAGGVYTPGNVMLQQRVQQSIANLDAAAQAVAAQMSAQKSAQSAAQALVSTVPNGLGDGGLKVDSHVASDPTLWQNANAPTQSTSNGQTTVEVKQNAAKAIMSWETFNVGRQTTVHFDQTGGTQTDGSNQWIALNRVNDPTGKPSQILGQIKAEGTVYLLNRNGVIFGGGAQVDTHSLIASSLDLFSNDVAKSNAFFMKYGVGATQDPEHILTADGAAPSFLTSGLATNTAEAGRGGVTVEQGASITVGKDGMVILAAPTVRQAGSLMADDALAILSAAPSLNWVAGAAGAMSDVSTTFAGLLPAGTPVPTVENTGLIESRRGRVHMLAEATAQDGVVVASTSLSRPGSIVFDGVTAAARVNFGGNSVTTILPEKDGETTSSTADADAAFVTSHVDINANAVMASGALMEVPAGNVTFGKQAYVDTGATIDVSGLANVTLPMSALVVIIPRIGQNELANSPLLRNSFLYTAKNVAVDSTQSGTRADGLDWIGSPVLNVAGYVNNVPRTVDELMIASGNITFGGSTVIRTGAQLRLEGGFLNYLPGYISTPRLQGANGLVYDIASADPDVDYTGFAGVFTQNHARWGVTETYTTSPLLANMGRWDAGFIRGGDAGTLSFGQGTDSGASYDFIIDGDISAHAYAGREQVLAGDEPLAGTLDIRVRDLPSISNASVITAADAINYVIQTDRVPVESYAPTFNEDSIIPARGGDPNDPDNPLWWRTLSTAMIDNAGFRKLRLDVTGTVLWKDGATLHVADGGEVDINASGVDIEGTIVAHGGQINLASRGQPTSVITAPKAPTFITVGAQGRLDASGLWVNDAGRSADDATGDHWIDGGAVSLTSWMGGGGAQDLTPDITLAAGSVVDVSGGGYVGIDGSLAMDGSLPAGHGGDVAIQTHSEDGAIQYRTIGSPTDLSGGAITLDGSIFANGFTGGGTLTLRAPDIQIGGEPSSNGSVATLYLDPAFFATQGFSSYKLIADTDATVAPGADLVILPQYMVADRQALLTLGNRTSLLGTDGSTAVASTAALDAFQRYQHRTDGDGISIQAGIYQSWVGALTRSQGWGVTGSVAVGEGAHIGVDAGDTIALTGAGHVIVDGSLSAPGGSIDLHNYGQSTERTQPAGRSLWLGSQSVLDVSGVSLLDSTAGAVPGDGTAVTQRRTGVVLDGGSIELQSDRNLIVEQGASLQLDGASDSFDLPTQGRRNGVDTVTYLPTSVWSDAGSLNLEATSGLFFDGGISAHGGALSAGGGRLSIAVHKPVISSTAVGPLIFQQSGWLVPDGADPYATVDPGVSDNGNLRFAVDRLSGSGIDDLLIGQSFVDNDTTIVATPVVFAGDVNLQTGRSIQIQSSTIALAAEGARGVPSTAVSVNSGHVNLVAPYVALAGIASATTPAATTGSGSLAIDADFIDIGGRINLTGMGNTAFASTGDIRFTIDPVYAYSQGIAVTGWLYTAGNLDFTGTRVYPATDYRFLIDASNPSAGTTVAFHQAATTDTSTPLSAGGVLAVGADHIEQGGTIWVPSGALALGTDDPAATLSTLGLAASMPLGVTQDVRLAPGSVTSVSLGGAVVPYGSTVDGKDWYYDGDPNATSGVLAKPPEKSLSIAGGAVAIDAGATVDLSGGGHVQAEEWVPGTGGARDVLAQSYTDYTGSQQGVSTSQYADGRPIYAVVPGYDAPLAARDAALEKGAGTGPMVGQAVYLSGVPGLPDGVYTLLPARYATLPGAFRVVQNTGVTDAVIGTSAATPDGSQIVAGYFTDALTGARDARASSFTVQSAATWGQYSEYALTSADTFFADAASANGSVVPRLGADAGRLTIAATAALTLGATLNAAPTDGGRGSQVDIAGDAIQVLGVNEAAQDGYLHVSADELTTLGAGSLLIGGKRESTSDGDRVDVIADHVLLSNDAAHPLQGSEVILVANGSGGVTLGDGSVLRATASDDAASAPLLFGQNATDTTSAAGGDGALLRVSGLAPATVVRHGITGLDGAPGTLGGNLVIGASSVIDAANAITMDATGTTSLAADATLAARAIDVTAGRIGLAATDPATQDQAGSLLIGPRVLAQLAQSDETTLRGRSGIDLFGDAKLRVANKLTLSAPTLTSDGGSASIAADTLTIANDTIAPAASGAAGNGALELDVRDLVLGSGNVVSQGLGTLDVHASGGLYASGTGTLDLAGANLAVGTPRIATSTGADNRIVTTGDVRLYGEGTADAFSRDTGGDFAIDANAIDLATAIVAPGGTVSLHATRGDVTVANGGSVDVGGLSLPFNDVAVHVPGGTVLLEADAGNVVAAAGSTIDLRGAMDGGNAGTLNVVATMGTASLASTLLGSAADSFLGGVLSVDTAGSVDLGDLVAQATAGGLDGSFSVHTRSGDLSLAAGDTLRAHLVNLTADGGDVSIAGAVDASGTFGGSIDVFGARGVDIDGTLDTSASASGRHGGDITLGTSGTASGSLDATYGYETVQRTDAGHIHIGSGAKIGQGGDTADGKLYLRAPLLVDGDVPVDIAPGLDLSHTQQTSLEAYVVWSTQDAVSDPSKHFDGLVDAGGWFTADPVTGRPVLVSGTFTDASGATVAAPDPGDAAQVTDYLSRYRFTPDATNNDHVSFYGYVNGDAGQGPGAVMGFIEQPGFTFDARLTAAVPGLAIRPGVELRNGDATVNGGDVTVLTNWNLGAGNRDADGNLQLAYRYGDAAPVINLRAEHDLDIRASITDGFFQDANAGGSSGSTPPTASYDEASAAWQEVLNLGLGAEFFPDIAGPPTEFTSGDEVAIGEYYGQYENYTNVLVSPLSTSSIGARVADLIFGAYANGFLRPSPAGAPTAPATPTNLNSYPTYLAKYLPYANAANIADGGNYDMTGDVIDSFAPLIAPPTTLDRIDTSAPVDNSPSPRATASNPLPLLSASLTGGQSSSYRFTAGADMASADPTATLASAAGSILLDGHSEYADPITNRVLAAPTLIRSGTGDIELAASGDIHWLDATAPAAIYTAGAPADGTSVDRTASLLQPSLNGDLIATATPELVLSGAVNPDGGGHIQLLAGGNIIGMQDTVDSTGDLTGTAGTPTAQYWWQWMQTTNSASRSAINFGAFDQGVMSIGGDVKVVAGGDIRQLSVSLPTTWTLDGTAGSQSLRVIGGGDLTVRAGGDILSGSYFVSRGQGSVRAGGSIGSDFSLPYSLASGSVTSMPVSTLIGMQDSQVDVTAGGGVDLGGIFNPSWFDIDAVNALAPAGHADGQSYSASSRIDVTALGGDLNYGDVISPRWLFAPGIDFPAKIADTAGDVLPATVNLIAAEGNLNLLSSGELFPSTDGNLGLLARDSVSFDMQSAGGSLASHLAWGIIDAPLSSMVSPLSLASLTSSDTSPATFVRKYGYLYSTAMSSAAMQAYTHAATPWRNDDTQPVRVYALNGDIVNGAGGGVGGVFLVPSKAARIEAGRDIVDLAYLGQQVHASDISVISAGRDIYDTALNSQPAGVNDPFSVLPSIVQAGAGNLIVDAGRNLGHLTSQSDYNAVQAFVRNAYRALQPVGSSGVTTGIDTVGNTYNPYLSADGASVYASFGTAPGIDRAAFIATYIDPSASKPAGLDDSASSLVDFVESYDAGLAVDTGLANGAQRPDYSVDQAWARFQQLPVDAQSIFVQKTLFRILATVGADVNDTSSPFAGQYGRGYAALNTLFPASYGYTANGTDGGENGAQQSIHTGDLDLRGSTIQTQSGGDVSILGPGGDVLLGSASAPPVIVQGGELLAGPNTQGVLTLRQGNVSMFTDGSTLLAQSRIFTEQGGDVTIWSSNGDINAGKGAKTTTEIPPVTYLCTQDAWCYEDPSGQVSGAGIATLQTVPGAPEGSVYLMAPRGTVDAGDAGIRVSGNLVIAAAHVANADNVQVKGDAVGLPVVQAVNVGALNAASSAASAATKAAEDVARQQQSDARDRQPSIISVQVIGGDPSASVDGASRGTGYDVGSPVQVVRRAGRDGDGLTPMERARLLQ